MNREPTLYQKRPGGNYYVRAQRNSREINQSLKTKNQSVAMQRAKALVAAAEAGDFDSVMRTRTRKGVATLGELEDAYRTAAQIRGLKHRTIQENVRSLQRLVKGSGAWKTTSSNVLDRKRVKKFVERGVPSGQDPAAVLRWRRSTRTVLRKARSLFAGWALEAYEDEDLLLPDLTSFLKAEGVSAKGTAKRYRRPPDEVVDRTLAAAAQLEKNEPKLFTVFLLVYPMAMRADEAAHARKDWLQCNGGRWEMEIPVNAAYMPKGARPRAVPCHPKVAAQLQAAADAAGGDFFLQGESRTARINLVQREFAKWMRKTGWERQKCAHELRALMGCRWFTEQGAEIAQKLLGHASVATTCAFYAEYSRDIDALPPDW